jgi:hypothetical protein
MIRSSLTILCLVFVLLTSSFAADPYEAAPAYAKPVPGNGIRSIQPLVTTGQQIPLTGGAPGDTFRVLGIPDGEGAYRVGGNQFKLLVNHEFVKAAGSPFGDFSAGARVSEFLVEAQKGGSKSSAKVLSGKNSFDGVLTPNASGVYEEVVAPPGIARLCSAFLADERVGFDRPIFLHGEETGPPDTFSPLGGSAFADFGGKTYQLTDIGHLPFENVVAAHGTGSKTVLIMMEDEGTLDSQLYMYVGEKNPVSSDPLAINGLRGGTFYVFAGDDAASNSEATFNTKGQVTTGHWEEVTANQSAANLQTDSVSVGAFAFTRLEDGAFDPKQAGVFYFDTTGRDAAPGNQYGRLYRLNFDPADPTGTATLTILLDGSEGIISPDNIDINKHGELILLEDPNFTLSAAPLNLTRNTYAWLYDTKDGSLRPILELDVDAARNHALGIAGNSIGGSASANLPGGWEFSGVIDAEDLLGRGSWILDVQAHSLRIAPTSETVEGGQILHVVWKPTE